MLSCPSNGGLNLSCGAGANHRHGHSGPRITGPVEAVVLACDGIGSYRITQSRDELLQRSLHVAKLALPAAPPVTLRGTPVMECSLRSRLPYGVDEN